MSTNKAPPLSVIQWLQKAHKASGSNNGGTPTNHNDGSGGAWGGSADRNAWVDAIRLECPPISNPTTQDAAFLSHIANLSPSELDMMIGEATLRKVYRVDAVCPKKSVESKHVAYGSTTTTSKKDESAGSKKQSTEDIMQEFAGFIDVDDADEAAVTSHVAGVVSAGGAPRDPDYDHNATCATGNCCAVPSCICGIRVVKNNPQSIAAFVRKVMNRMGESTTSLSGTPKRPLPSGLERTISKSILHANYGEGDEGRAALEGTLEHIINTCSTTPTGASVHPRLIGDVPHTGLRNIRNTCYMNSVLQLLYHIPEVRQAVILASIPSYSDNNNGGGGSLIELGLGQLFATMMYGAVDVVDTYDVTVDGLRIDPREQQDAQEFLGLMLQLLTSVAPQPSLIEAVEPAVATNAKLSDLSNLRQVLTRAFESSQVYQRVCASCGGCKYRADTAPFHTVPLVKEACDDAIDSIYRKATAAAPVVLAEADGESGSGHRKAVDVDEASNGMLPQEDSDQVDMSSFFDNDSSSRHNNSFPAANTLPTLEASLLKLLSPGTIDGYSCEDCGANSATNNVGITRMSLKKMPEYLVFHLGRFQYDLRRGDRVKINTALDFPNFLDMGKVMEEGSEVFNTVVAAMSKGGETSLPPPTKVKDASGAECWYQLEAIVNHHGATPRSGHYTFSARCIRRTDSEDSSCLVRETVVGENFTNLNNNSPSTTEPVWVHCDDGSISDLPARTFGAHQDRYRSKDAYLLVYRRVDRPTASSSSSSATPSPTSAANTKAEAIEVDTPTPAPAPGGVVAEAGDDNGDTTPRKSNKKSKGAVSLVDEDIPTEDDDDEIEVAQGSGITALTNLRNSASTSLINALASNPANWQTFLPTHIRASILGDNKDSNSSAFNPTIRRVYDQHVALKKYLTDHLISEWLPLADAVFGTKGSKGKSAVKITMLTSTKPIAVEPIVATTRSGRPIRPIQPVEVDESEEEEEAIVNTADERVFVPTAWLRLFGAVFSDRPQADKLLCNPQKKQACETSPPIRTKGRRVVSEGAGGASHEDSATPPSSAPASANFGYTSWSNDRRLREARLASAFAPNGEMQESVLPFTVNKAYAACLGYKHIPELLETAAQEGHGMLCIHGLIRPPAALPMQDLEESQLVRNSTIHTYANHTAAGQYKLIPKAAAKAIRDWAGMAGLLPLTSTNGMCRVCTAVEVLKLKSKRNVEKQEHLFRDACDQLQLFYKKWEAADTDPQSQIKASASLRALRELAWVPAKFLDWWLSQPFSQATPTQATLDLTKRKKKATPTPKKSGSKKPNSKGAGISKSVQFAEESEATPSKDEDVVEPYDLSRHLLCKCYMANEDDGFGEPKTNTLPPTVAPFAACVPIPKEVFDYLVMERGFLATTPIVTTSEGGECSAGGISQYLNPPRCAECVKTSTQGTQRQIRLRSEKHDQLRAISTAARVTGPAKTQQQREADLMFEAIRTGSRACVDVSNATEVGAVPHLHWLSLLCPVESQPGLSLEDAEVAPVSSSSSAAPVVSVPLSLIGREINKSIFKKNLTTAVKAHVKAWEKDREAAEKVAAEEAQKKIVSNFLGAGGRGGRGGRGGKVLNLSAKSAVHIDCDAPETKPSTTTSSSPPPPFVGTTYVALPLPWVSVWHTWARQVEAALPPAIYPPTPTEGGTVSEEVHMISDIIQNSQAAERARQAVKFPGAPMQTSTAASSQHHHEEDADDDAAGAFDERVTIRSILRRNLEASFHHLQASNHLFCLQHPGHLLIAPEDLNPVKCGYDLSGGADECSNNGLFLPSAAQALSALGGVVKAGDTLTRSGVEKLTKVFNDYSNNPAYPPYVLIPYDELTALEACMLGGSEDVQQHQQQHHITTVFERHYPQLLVGGGIDTVDDDIDDDVKVVPPPSASRAPLPTGLPLLLLQEVDTERVMLSYPTCTACRTQMLLQREEALRTFGCGGAGVGGAETEEGGAEGGIVGGGEDGSIKVHMKIRKSKKGAFHQSVDTIGGVHGGTNMVVISQLCATSLLESHGLLVDASKLHFFHSNKQLTTAQRGTAKDDKSIPVLDDVTLASQGIKNLGNLYCLFDDGVAISVGGDQAAVGESFGNNNKGRSREEATFGSTRLGGLGGDVADAAMVSAAGGGDGGGPIKECPVCTYHNSSLLTSCEMCESPLM